MSISFPCYNTVRCCCSFELAFPHCSSKCKCKLDSLPGHHMFHDGLLYGLNTVFSVSIIGLLLVCLKYLSQIYSMFLITAQPGHQPIERVTSVVDMVNCPKVKWSGHCYYTVHFCRGVFSFIRELPKHVDHLISKEIILLLLKSLFKDFTNSSRRPLYKVASKSESFTFFS